MCVLCVSIYVDVHQNMTPACIFESPWKSGNLSVCFTVTIKIVKNKNLKNNYIKKHQKTPKSKTKKKKTKTPNKKKQKKRIPSILEGYTFFSKDKKINRTVTVSTHFLKIYNNN